VHLRLILVGNQREAQFLFYVYLNPLHVLILRRTIVWIQFWYNHSKKNSLIFRVIIPEVIFIQLSSWGWALGCSKHVENSYKHIIEEIVRQVGYLPELLAGWYNNEEDLMMVLTCICLRRGYFVWPWNSRVPYRDIMTSHRGHRPLYGRG
jgi:hypothetical protein